MHSTQPAATDSPWPDDLLDGPKLNAAAAARRIGTQIDRKIAPSTVWRWCVTGKGGVHLPHIRYGRRVLTTAAAIEWFGRASAVAALQSEPRVRTVIASDELAALIAQEGL